LNVTAAGQADAGLLRITVREDDGDGRAGASAAPRTGAILPARRAEAAICHRAQSINYDNVREIPAVLLGFRQ
jgi:hypothetical protein